MAVQYRIAIRTCTYRSKKKYWQSLTQKATIIIIMEIYMYAI